MAKIFTLASMLVLWNVMHAQIILTPNNNGNQLAQILAGSGVTITNVTINCPGTSAGTFTCNNCNIGMSSGIALTSGDINAIAGPNNQAGAGIDNLAPGNAQLTSLVGGLFASTYDACVLEFDIQVLSDSVEFKYSFGSEEYLEWVSAGYNDVFAFYISGPGIAGQQNIALVPGTATPVSIDNVNDVSNSAYYVDNGDGFTAPQNGSNYYIQYDGFTTVLTAKRKNLQPCQTYHLRLAIADAGDGILDSGVFLEANSLTSNGVTVDDASTNDPNTSNAMEGCVNGKIVFRIDNPVPTPVTVTYQIGGTATNGTDYQNISNTITIPAGDTTATLNIVSLTDALIEGTETVAIYLLNACNNQPYDSAVMQIFDPFPVRTMNDTSICAGDQVTLASQGLGVYSWSPAASLSSASALSPIATPTVTTTYIITANIGSCTSRDTVTVNVIAPPFSVNAGNDVSSCAGGAVALNAVVSGNPVNGQAFQYLWSPAAGLSSTNTATTNATPAGAATYVIQVSSGSCRVTDTVNVSVGQLSITTNSTNETCYGYLDGTAAVTSASGASPINYLWNNNTTTASLTGIGGGSYTVTVSDANSCSATATLIVGSTNAIHFTQPTINNVNCYSGNDGLISISANGGAGSLYYLWNNGSTSTTISLLTANTYTLTATDANGCHADTSIIITQPAQLSETVQFNNVSCNGSNNGSIDITVSGGVAPYTYLWNDGTATQDRINIGPGNYAVTITDLNNCSGNLSFTINEPNPMILVAAVSDAICNGSSTGGIDLSVNGGTFPYNYLWSNGTTSQDLTQASAGSYSVMVTDANNCTATNNQTIGQPTALAVSLTKTDLQCFGDNSGSVTSSVSGGTPGYTYLWSNNAASAIINTIAAGNYAVTVNDLQLCQASASITVNEPTELTINITSSDVLCHGDNSGSCNVTANGGTPGYNYIWSNGIATANNNNIPVGNYSVTVSDVNTCSATGNATLTEPALLSAILASLPPLCVGGNDGSINTTMTGGVAPFSYTLSSAGNTLASNNTGSFPGLSSGNYQVQVTDGNNCPTSSTVSILSPYPDEFTFTSTPTSCYGADYNDGSIIVTPLSTLNQPYTYNIDNTGNQLSGSFTNLSTGLHQIVIYNNNGCQTDTSYVVAQPAEGTATILYGDTTITLGQSVNLASALNNYNSNVISGYAWLPADGLSCNDCPNPVFNGFASTSYSLTITYNNGCVANATTKIFVEGYPPVFVPNAFTPNGDGNNDVFMIYGESIKNIGLMVFDRWGEKVFESSSQFEGWDGTFAGRQLNPAVYVYVAGITYLDGKKMEKKGTVTLLK